ncbi:CRISPR-associated protein Cas5 [Agathobaculum sp. LCP25S3_E8]|uniref:CRISPR-associated protein Cas5 n=1 Tax=Agathobaculum sp. LCP25S3_E8 TaxID=3438735 RepID=UPI003F912078
MICGKPVSACANSCNPYPKNKTARFFGNGPFFIQYKLCLRTRSTASYTHPSTAANRHTLPCPPDTRGYPER